MSTLFVRTLREDPADAEVPSHKLLVRAGYIRRAAPGIYTWLPLGLRVLRRIEQIIRDEMDAIGAQEVSFPALLPKEPYEATGRWVDYGDGIFRLKDRKEADYLLGPTVVDSVAAVFASTDARWVFGRVVSDIGGRQVPPGWKMPRYSRQRLLRGNFIAHPAVYMRRDFFQELGGFDTRLKYAMDYDLWLRASVISAPAYVDAHLAAHRRHGGSASTANARAAFLEDHEVRRRYLGANPMVRAFHELIHARRGKRLGARQVG